MDKDLAINEMLSQMRMMASSIERGVLPYSVSAEENQKVENSDKVPFGDIMKQAADKVNDLQTLSKTIVTAFEKGDSNVDLPDVMVASQKAKVAFDAMLQVRKQLVSAYQEIMNLPV